MNKILIDREKRLEFIQSFFNENNNDSLILIKANIPGTNKNIPVAYHVVRLFKNLLIKKFRFEIYRFVDSYDGPYYMLKSPNKDISFKYHLIKIETEHPLGRLVDLDFFINSDESVSRNKLELKPRKCLICDDDAHICARSMKHTTDELLHLIETLFLNYLKEDIVRLADESIMRELNLENKFGLVTPTTTGSHHDMDYHLMVKAKDSLLSYFKEIFEIGYHTTDLDSVLSQVRNIGIEAENKMYNATNGVNCYKGIIFLLGLSLLALGYTLKNNQLFDDIFKNIKIISKDIFKDFDKYDDTIGTKLYKEQNIEGIRGIVYSGLEDIKKYLNTKIDSDIELINLLYQYIISIEDTVFIKRSKTYENYLKHKKHFLKFDIYKQNDLKALNEYAINNNLSFGGAADLLIITIFFIKIKNTYY